jgi:hypothetical protein
MQHTHTHAASLLGHQRHASQSTLACRQRLAMTSMDRQYGQASRMARRADVDLLQSRGSRRITAQSSPRRAERSFEACRSLRWQKHNPRFTATACINCLSSKRSTRQQRGVYAQAAAFSYPFLYILTPTVSPFLTALLSDPRCLDTRRDDLFEGIGECLRRAYSLAGSRVGIR